MQPHRHRSPLPLADGYTSRRCPATVRRAVRRLLIAVPGILLSLLRIDLLLVPRLAARKGGAARGAQEEPGQPRSREGLRAAGLLRPHRPRRDPEGLEGTASRRRVRSRDAGCRTRRLEGDRGRDRLLRPAAAERQLRPGLLRRPEPRRILRVERGHRPDAAGCSRGRRREGSRRTAWSGSRAERRRSTSAALPRSAPSCASRWSRSPSSSSRWTTRSSPPRWARWASITPTSSSRRRRAGSSRSACRTSRRSRSCWSTASTARRETFGP